MIKVLQKRFIITAMAAVSLLLFVMIGAINLLDYWLLDRQTDRTLYMLSENEGQLPPKMPHKTKPMPDIFNPPMNEDMFMAARYFTVSLNESGEVLVTDMSRISSVTEEEAQEYIEKALGNKKESGNIKQFKYQRGLSGNGREVVYVFLDRSGQLRSFLLVLIISVGIGVLCWGLMLLLVIVLSKKAIYPIAKSMEKQKQFVTNAGHEIKTPLAILLANTDALELRLGANKWSNNIRTQTLRLNGLMQNLLMLSRMDEEENRFPKADFSLTQLLKESMHPFYETASQKAIVMQEEIQPDIMLHGNRENIAQLCSILFDNAVKYTNVGGEIVVGMKKKDKSIFIFVKNTCDKLPEKDPEKLFDRFYRGDEARTQKSGGYGIGLSVAKAIVESHKGSITVEYENQNTIKFLVRI